MRGCRRTDQRPCVRAAARALCLASLLVVGASIGLGQQPSQESPEPPATDRIVVVFFDVGGTLTYRDRETGKYAWYSDALESVEALHGLGLKIGLLSNVPRGWDEAMLARLLAEPEPLTKLFDPVVLAQSPPPPGYPPPKPDPLAYQNALAQVGVNTPPFRALYVGEDRAEVRGARLAGMQALLLVRRGRPPRDDPQTIRNLTELVELMKGEE